MQKAQGGTCDQKGHRAVKKPQQTRVWIMLRKRNVPTEGDKRQITQSLVTHVINCELHLKGSK